LGKVTTNSYDAAGNLLTTTDPLGKTTSHGYNASGQLSSTTDALGHVTSYSYDGSGNLISQVDAAGTAITSTYDSNGNRLTQSVTRTTPSGPQALVTQYQYDAANHLVKTIYPDGSSSQIAYNSNGQKSSTTDGLGNVTTFQYDSAGRLLQTAFPDGTKETVAFDADGRRTQSTTRSGVTTLYTYDPLGHLTAQTNTSTGGTVSKNFDAVGQVVSSTDQLGNTSQYAFDAAGNETQITSPLHQVTSFTYDADSNQTSMTDANGHITSFLFDADNRPTRTTLPDGTFETTTYDAVGHVLGKTDAAGNATQYSYDFLGRLTSVTDALGHAVSYAYDEIGERTSQTDANGHVTTFTYDPRGRLATRILPGAQVETNSYDANGNAIAHRDFNGKTTTYTYDSLNRLLSKVPDSSFHAAPVTFTYTRSGNRASMTDPSGTTTYAYDSSDRLISANKPNGTITYSFDVANNLISASDGGTQVTYSYDGSRRLASVSEANTGTTNYSYDSVGNLSAVTYPNGVSHAYSYNSKNQLNDLAVNKGASPVASFAYTLDAVGHRLSATELSGRTVAYGYDNIYRLTSETVAGAAGGLNGTAAYSYDPAANRTQVASTLTGVPAGLSSYDANDRLISDVYDANGNTITSGGVSNVYDFENRLIQHGAVTIVYDGDGNRVSKTASGITTKYLVDDRSLTGYSQVISETGSDGSTKTLVYGLERISQRQFVASTSATLVSYYVYDGHGSTRALTDAAGTVTDFYDYDAFGNLLSSSGSTPNEFLFAGEQFDADLHLYFLRARYLNTATGRFLTMDVMEIDPQSPLSLHRYLYASSDPVNRIDPSGNQDLISLSISTAISTTLDALPYIVGFRLIQLAYRVATGANLGAAAQEAALGVVTDVAFTFAFAGVLRFATGFVNLRAAGQVFSRAANSIWNFTPFARGSAVEDFIFTNVLGRARSLAWSFPVIDDFFAGVATSIKSLDLTAASYQSGSAIISRLSKYAAELAAYQGGRFAGVTVANITDRVLLVAFEDGAGTVIQGQALEQFLQTAATQWPNIKIVFQFIP